MPTANIHYHFTKDALIDTIYQISFEGSEADWNNDETSPNVYDGVVKGVLISNEIEVAVELGGEPNSNWSLKVTVFLISNGVESKQGCDIDEVPITGNIAGNSYCWYDENHTIKF
jgi:hypothetical protein